VANINTGCPLCVFRGCEGDFCRHGASDEGNGYHICLMTGSRFDVELLRALSRDPIRQALIFDACVGEPTAGQVESRLDHRLSVGYGRTGGSAHLVIDALKDLKDTAHTDFGWEFEPRFAPSAPKSLKLVADSLVRNAGFRVISGADDTHQLRTFNLARGRKIASGAVIGIHVSLTYYVEIRGRDD
jgi:hypothetical protein